MKRLKNGQGGFVLTVELLLIITVLVLGSIVGIVAIRDALLNYQQANADRSITVYDSQGQKLGPMIGFDEHEAPLLFYFDRTLHAADSTKPVYRALIGVRDDRFTSREPIYYTGLNCQGTPCIKKTSTEQTYLLSDIITLETESINEDSVSYFHALQGGPNYAVGRSSDGGVRGALYREGLSACPLDLIGEVIGSRYMSQRLVQGSPCESPIVLPQLLGNELVAAVPVTDINNPEQNALDGYTAPYKVSMPASVLNANYWEPTPPKAEN